MRLYKLTQFKFLDFRYRRKKFIFEIEIKKIIKKKWKTKHKSFNNKFIIWNK